MEQSGGRSDAAGGVDAGQMWTSAQRRYGDIQANLMRSQVDAYTAAQKSLLEAQGKYFAAMKNLGEELSARYREAHHQYLARAMDAAAAQAASSSVDEARSAFEQSAAGVMDEFRKRSEELSREIATATERASSSYNMAVREAYRAFLQAQRDFWAELKIDEMIPRQ